LTLHLTEPGYPIQKPSESHFSTVQVEDGWVLFPGNVPQGNNPDRKPKGMIVFTTVVQIILSPDFFYIFDYQLIGCVGNPSAGGSIFLKLKQTWFYEQTK
jgi:hypothetical protein